MVGHVINIHNNIKYGYINMVEVTLIDEAKVTNNETHGEVHHDNTVKVTKE